MKFIENNQKNKVYYWSIVCLMTFLFAMLLFTPITYAINDDVAMKNIASGVISGTPDGHLIFIKYALGYIISVLYRLYDGIDWYGSFMIGVMLLCTVMILKRFVCFLKKDFVFGITASATIFMIVIYDNIVNFQFTVVAAIVAATALFLYNTIDLEKQNYQKEYLVILLLAWTAYCIRSRVFIMALPFAGVIFFTSKDKLKNKLVFAVILLMGIFAIEGVETVAYDSKEWDDYLKFNEARSELYDYYGIPSYEENEEFYKSINIKKHDVENLKEYRLYFVSDEVRDGKVNQVADYAKQQWEQQNTITEKMGKGLDLIIERLRENEFGALFFITLFVLVLNLYDAVLCNKGTIGLSVIFVAVEITLWIYLAFEGRLPERVIVSLLIIELFSLMSIWYTKHNKFIDNYVGDKSKNLFYVVMCLFIVMNGQRIEQRQNSYYNSNMQFEIVTDYFERNPENLYFIETCPIAKYTENYSFFNKNKIENFSTLGGWLAFSPLRKEGLENFKIENVARATVNNTNVFVVLETITDEINEFYNDKFGNIQWHKTDNVNNEDIELGIYKLRQEQIDNSILQKD